MHPRYRGPGPTRPHRLCAALALAAAVAPTAALAGGTRVHVQTGWGFGPAPGQGFNLHVERRDIDVAYDDRSGGDRLEVGRIGIAWFETPMPGLRVGLEGGRQELEQGGRGATAGRELVGYYAGFDSAIGWQPAPRVRLEIGGRLAYSEVDSAADPGVDIDWWSATVRPEIAVRAGAAVTLRAGVRGAWFDGDERVGGATPATTGFREASAWGGFAGLDIHTGNGGRVGLRADGGSVESLRLVFERRY